MNGPATPATSPAADALENRYYAYLRAHGYSSSAALLDVLRVYLPRFADKHVVADLGCGHGEFLALLQAAGHEVYGVDVDPAMVAHCQAQGFDVTLGDAVPWLAARPARFDAVFSSNVVEHLPAQMVQTWVAAAFGALRPGGLLLLATPNPAALVVQFYEFWRDPTHVRMYSPQLLEFMLADAGFAQVASFTNPAAHWEGVDKLLAGVDAPLPPFAAPVLQEPTPPLPTPPNANAPLRQRWAYRLADWAYHKFTEPYLLPLWEDLARARRAVDAQAAALDALSARHELLLERIRTLAAADRFLYPAREFAVIGYKPAAPTNQAPPQ